MCPSGGHFLRLAFMLKTPATYEEQIKKLREHKCIVADEAFCTDVLMRISYYRLCAYLLPYRTKDGNRYSATRFEKIYALYEFDRKMRNLLFAAIEETEVFLRASFSYFHAHKYGAIGYEAPSNFNNRHDHEKFIRKLNAEIRNNQNVLFVKHHQECYDGRFPLWVAMELFTFGMLSYFYADLHMHDQKALATELFDSIPKKVISWLRCCTDLRNICAHYGPAGAVSRSRKMEQRAYSAHERSIL